MTVALRSLLRFLHQRGDIATDLEDSVPATASWSLAGLPKYLSPRQTELLLKTCKHDDPVAQRDRTILLLLARLRLRAGEVVHMTLDDIDWDAGELTVRGKGGRQDICTLNRGRFPMGRAPTISSLGGRRLRQPTTPGCWPSKVGHTALSTPADFLVGHPFPAGTPPLGAPAFMLELSLQRRTDSRTAL